MELTTKTPDFYEPFAGTPHECYNNVYQEVIRNEERVGVLGYIYKRELCIAHCWYMESDGLIVDMTIPDSGWNYVGYVIPTDEWMRRVQETPDNLSVLTQQEITSLQDMIRRESGVCLAVNAKACYCEICARAR